MRTEYSLFPDRREAVGERGSLEGERPGDGDELIKELMNYDWQYPLIVLFREGGENRWSFTVIQPQRKEHFDDEAR